MLKSGFWKFACLGFFLSLATQTTTNAQTQKTIDADVLLSGGTLHIGNGEPAQVGDIAIVGDRIEAVGRIRLGKVKQVIDCSGFIVSPGFIDLHNHSDGPVLREKTRAVVNFLTQGCTTILTGNCGSGPIDVGQFYGRIDTLGAGVNVVHLLPQGNLRREVMGTERRDAAPDELAKMRKLADKAMSDGAWGMSTGLIYVPSSYANTNELIEIAKVVSKHRGIYASHIRGEGTNLLDSVDEALEIGRRADLPVHISHFKSSGKDSWGIVRTAIEAINKQRAAGQTITADQYPYTASSTSLSATMIPAWARAGGREATLARLASDSDEGKRIREAIRQKLVLTDNGHRIQIANHAPHPDWAGQRLDDLAKAEGMEPFDFVLHIERAGGASIVNHSINEEDVRFVMTQPWVATASDGSAKIPSSTIPHPRNYGTFPRKIGYYSVREKAVPLSQAIRSATGLPADILGMKDRGYLKAGYAADIVVWRESELIDTATFEAPHAYSQGMHYVFVNGTPAIAEGKVTGALAGRALRHECESKPEASSR